MIIAPSLLASDYSRFGAEAVRADRSGGDWLHLDVMDGHFVPNISFGPEVIRAVRPLTKMVFDVHLMCWRPEILLEPCVKAGAEWITVHVELGNQVTQLIWKIRSLGKKVGLALNPGTPATAVEPYLSQVDLILIMTVNPGFGGQPFIRETLPKIQQVHGWRTAKRLGYKIQVDGGINFDTAVECARAGADTFVSGTGLFKEQSMKRAVRKMRSMVTDAATTLA